MVDNESINIPHDEIIKMFESAHKVIIPVVGKSLNELGLHYDYIVTIDNKSVENSLRDWMAENNLEYIEESVGQPNMTLQEKINFIADELQNINSEENTLLIVDPYIFPKNHDDDYMKLFCEIIEKCKVSAVKVITTRRHCNIDLKNQIEGQLHIALTVYDSKNLHDRWWIVENIKKGFTCGPSLNGVGKDKLSTIKQIDAAEIDIILQSFENQITLID